MHYDLGYIDLEQQTLQTLDNPFGARLSPMSYVLCYLCLRVGHPEIWRPALDKNNEYESPFALL